MWQLFIGITIWILLPVSGLAQQFDFDATQHPEDTTMHIFVQQPFKASSFNINGEPIVATKEAEGVFFLVLDSWKSFAYIKAVADDGSVKGKLYHFSQHKSGVKSRHIPLWVSILPPLLAILLALVTKEVVSALFGGIWIGAWAINGFTFKGLFDGFLESVSHIITNAIADTDHIAVIVFSLLIGGMVSLISRNGGMAGIVNKLARYAVSAKKSQLITWLLGIAIFFDDYANTLIVGNTMRTLTDKFRVSREKLAYIVDSTAAPIAAVALVTTWIGAELGYIEEAVAGLEGINMGTYGLFLQSLKYSFYPVFAIVFMLVLITNQLDFGPMYNIEKHARETGDVTGVDLVKTETKDETDELQPVDDKPHKWYNAFLPIAVVLIATLLSLYYTGYDESAETLSGFKKLQHIIGNADSYAALLWGSSLGLLTAILLTLIGRILPLKQAISSVINGFKTMMNAVIILVLAWGLAYTTKQLHTADFITNALGNQFSPYLFPAIVFIISGLISFSTGSSWSTMAILYPLVIPTVWKISSESGMPESVQMEILFNTISVVLAGSVFGDHCSPISDTTILSSLASKCNHLSHVKTQLPYALTVGLISIAIGGIFVHLRLPALINFAVGIFMVWLTARFLGKKVVDYRIS